MAVDGGDGDGISQAQVVELVVIRVGDSGGVHLVDSQDDGLAAAQQHGRHLLIGGGKAGLDIRQEDDDVGVVNGDLGLIPHKGQDLIIRAGLDAAGVDEGERPAVPVRLPVDAVPGDAGGILHDGKALADELVEEHGLAHIGAAHDGHDGLGHDGFLLQSGAPPEAREKPPSAGGTGRRRWIDARYRGCPRPYTCIIPIQGAPRNMAERKKTRREALRLPSPRLLAALISPRRT